MLHWLESWEQWNKAITSYVQLYSYVDEEIRDLSINLSGTCRVIYAANAASIGLTGLKTFEDSVQYFFEEKLLFQGPDFPVTVFCAGQVHK